LERDFSVRESTAAVNLLDRGATIQPDSRPSFRRAADRIGGDCGDSRQPGECQAKETGASFHRLSPRIQINNNVKPMQYYAIWVLPASPAFSYNCGGSVQSEYAG
jgi:hypothetical protein